MPNIPNTNQNGLTLLSIGNGSNASYWGSASSGGQFSHTFVIPGPIALGFGSNNDLPPFYLPVTDSVELLSVRASCQSGTFGMTFAINGSLTQAASAGLGYMNVTATPTTFTCSTPISISNDDGLNPHAFGGTGIGLSFSFYFQVIS